VLVHLNNLSPIRSNLRKVQALAQIHKVKDILLEARASKADGSLEELGANTGIIANSMGDFVNVGSSSLANSRQGVDGGDSLREHGVGGELGKLGGPETNGKNTLLTTKQK
jgi:hypothetical protein